MTLQSEIRLWERVKMIAEANLKKYPNTENFQETQNGQNCRILKEGEKKILHFLIETADLFIGICKMNKKDAKAFVNSKTDFKPWFYYYKLIEKLL